MRRRIEDARGHGRNRGFEHQIRNGVDRDDDQLHGSGSYLVPMLGQVGPSYSRSENKFNIDGVMRSHLPHHPHLGAQCWPARPSSELGICP